MLVANKVDDPRDADFYEFYALGVGRSVPGVGDQRQGLRRSPRRADRALAASRPSKPEDALRVAVVGRPNVGKSSFVNRLLGENRLVVSEIAGTTRDAIDTPMRYHDRLFVFVDTAGLRRQSKIDDGIEFYSSLRTRRAIERADICILMVDATEGEIQNQDLKIAALAWEAGRGLIVVVNKWDLAEKDDKATAKYEKAAYEKAPFLKFVPFLFTSALTGQRVTRVLELLLEVEQERGKRISTSEVNEKLGELLARLQPPQHAGREVQAQLRDAGRDRSADDRRVRQRARSRRRALRALPAQRLPRVLGLHGQSASHRHAAQGRMMLALAGALIVSYLLGSIPAAHIAGLSKGIDLRKHGSGNLGATNVIRVLGTKIGLIVFAFDMAKGALPGRRLFALASRRTR